MVLSPTVRVAGELLAPTWLNALIEVRVEREFQVPARCTLRFLDPGYVLVGSGKVHLGTEVVVSAGTDGAPELVDSEVTSIAVDQREGEQPELVVVAHDRSHRMGRGTRIKSHQSMTYSDMVRAAAAEHGLSAAVGATTPAFDYVMQADSDLGFVTELARRTGYDWWVDGRTLHFDRPATTHTVHLELGGELRSFSVRASGHHPDAVKVDGWDRSQQQLVEYDAVTPSVAVRSRSDLAGAAGSTTEAFSKATLNSAGLGATSVDEARDLAQSILDRGAASSVTVRGVSDGNGSIAPGAAVEVAGAGPLSGTYPVTKVEHVHRPRTGFVTRFFSGDRRPTSLVDSLAPGARPPLAGLRHGLYVAEVTSIQDPENRGRVKIRYPGVASSEESGWARLVAVGGGTDRGNVFVPEVQDEVLVAFEGGDPRQPVVIGGLHGAKSTIPPIEVADGKVQVRGMTSRLGHVVMLYDGADETDQAIGLVLAGAQHQIRLGKDKLDIAVPEGVPVNVTAGGSSLTIGKDGSIALKAPKVTIDAEEEIELTAPKINVTGNEQVNVQAADVYVGGATVSVEGDGDVSVKGGMVMIN